MDKVNEFRVGLDEVDIWLEGFEARLLESLNIGNEAKKIKWCKAVIGNAGRGILRNCDPNLSWEEIKDQLRKYLGEEDSRAAAWRSLKYYKPAGKSIGETAAEILNLSRRAANEEDVQQRLVVETFIEALLWKTAQELRRKRPTTVQRALEEAKFMIALDEEEQERKKHIGSLEVRRMRLDMEGPRS